MAKRDEVAITISGPIEKIGERQSLTDELVTRLLGLDYDVEVFEGEGGFGFGSGPEAAIDPVEFPDFASDAARAKAEDLDLHPNHFEGIEPDGKTGFTVAGVEAVAAERDAALDEPVDL